MAASPATGPGPQRLEPLRGARIRSEAPSTSAGVTRLEGALELPDGRRHDLSFEFTHPEAPAAAPGVRPFLLAFLPAAMRLGTPLRLDAAVDATTIGNLMEWQAAWASWAPERLSVVPIEAPLEPSPPRRPPSARGVVAAFSGGVDSCFTAWRHTRRDDAAPLRRLPLRAGLTVHGFDVPLEQEEVFTGVRRGAADVLHALGLESFWLRTDVRRLEGAFDCDWPTEAHGMWLAAALACLEPWFDGSVIPATYPYARLSLPWGSNPIGDPLLGSRSAPCWHDGAEHTKLSKIQAMARHPAIEAGLRVCWEGERLDRNCGGCFKCVTTQACFWLAGVERPAAFPTACGLEEVRGLPVRTEQNDYLLARMQATAAQQGRGSLARALARARGARRRRRRAGRSRGWARLLRARI